MARRNVFVAGGTGYIGRAVLPLLASRGHSIRALVRPGSEAKLPPGCEPVSGDALRGETFASRIPPSDTFLQLVGVPHPSPSKASLFRSVDLASAKASADAAAAARVAHFVYVSVAHPAPAMRAYWEARAEAEDHLARLGLAATILRPWYVLGPGHLWPHLLRPGYWIAERLPGTRETARRLGLVTLPQMAAAIVRAIESPGAGTRIVEVPGIRAALPLPPQS
jgi:uncharacterized protein YbjT (DUF2867 family)